MSDSEGPQGRSGRSVANLAEPVSTIELLARIRKGDRQALDLLFDRHRKPLQRWASGRLPRWARDITDTDDLVQDTLLQTLRRLDAFDARRSGALHAYLRQAVLNRIRDELRRHRRRPASAELTDGMAPESESPLEAVVGREMVERYERSLAMLRMEDRDAIIGRVELGYSYEELAGMLGKPTAEAARKAAARALVRLAEQMGRAAQ